MVLLRMAITAKSENLESIIMLTSSFPRYLHGIVHANLST